MNNPKTARVSAILPAYNEELTISSALEPLLQVPEISQIIVVNDASVDLTVQVVQRYQKLDGRIHLLHNEVNQGKALTVLRGIAEAQNSLLLLLDSDLVGLQPVHVQALIDPVFLGLCDMSIGLFRGGRFRTDWSHRIAPFLSGQRCLRWNLFSSTPYLSESRWGLEVALNLHAARNHYRVSNVFWHGVTHKMRMEKRPSFEGYLSHCQMWLDIARYLRKVMLPLDHNSSWRAYLLLK